MKLKEVMNQLEIQRDLAMKELKRNPNIETENPNIFHFVKAVECIFANINRFLFLCSLCIVLFMGTTLWCVCIHPLLPDNFIMEIVCILIYGLIWGALHKVCYKKLKEKFFDFDSKC